MFQTTFHSSNIFTSFCKYFLFGSFFFPFTNFDRNKICICVLILFLIDFHIQSTHFNVFSKTNIFRLNQISHLHMNINMFITSYKCASSPMFMWKGMSVLRKGVEKAFTVFLLLNQSRPDRDLGRVGIPPFRNKIEARCMAENLPILKKID